MINVQAVAEYLASNSGTGTNEDTALIASLLTIANSLASQQQQTGGALASAAQLPAPTAVGTGPSGLGNVDNPPEVETLAEGIKMFVQRYPIDSRAYEYLVTSPATVVAHVLRDFRPPHEGEADYSRIITTYVKRIRAAYSGTSDSPLAVGPNLGATSATTSAPLLGVAPGIGMAPGFAANKPVIIRPPASIPDPTAVDYAEVIQQFMQKYPVDERAYNFLVNASPSVLLRVLQEFRPHRMGDSDYSALLTTFTKKCMDQARAQDGAPALAALAAPMGGSLPHQQLGGGGCTKVSRTVQLPPGGMPRDLATAMITPGIDEFLTKYPLDERAYDYFAVSSNEVQLKVMQEFQPIREGEASYSGLFTAFVKKCRTIVANNGGVVDAGAAPGGIMGDEFQVQPGEFDDLTASIGGGLAEGVTLSTSSLKRTLAALRTAANETAGAPLDLEAFRLRYPMDERAFDFLSTAPREVQERVLETFVPQRLDDSDFSAAITAYVRSLRNQVAEASVMGGVSDEAVMRFFERYPCDARASDYFNMCSPDVQAQVLRDFRPRSEGDADYSAAITAYIKCCRGSQKQLGGWRPPAGGWGPPKRPRLF